MAIVVPPAPELIFNGKTVDESFSSFILPYIILWDPLNQLSHSFPMLCPQPLNKVVYWKWGQSDGLQPRTTRVIHDVDCSYSSSSLYLCLYGCLYFNI